MSKYRQRGAYHYEEFAKQTPYRYHVVDLVARMKEALPKGGRLLDVGCGEGLIMSQLRAIGFTVVGCEIDPIAVKLGLERGNDIRPGEIDQFDGDSFDAVLLCDVLEHVKDPITVMATARRLAPIVVIAVPDRHDRHAIHEVTPESVHDYFPLTSCWNLVHQDRRHARHLMIFAASQGEET